MADNDRYRGYDQGRSRDREQYGQGREGQARRDDDGYIARRGFGNRSAGYDRGPGGDTRNQDYERDQGWRDQGTWDRGRDQGYDRPGSSRERDFGDSAGYGSGGSARDWRDVMGDDRSGRSGGGFDRDRSYGQYGSGGDYGRTGSSQFGRGSREDDDDRGFLERAGDEVRSWFGGDERQGGEHHRGRGPRNYTRSDDRIRDDVNDRLTDDPHIDASDIEVSVSNREVTLSGHVNNRFEKRHAEDLAESVSGVTHVQNNLRVQQQNAMAGQNALAGMGGSSSTMTRDVVESYGGGRGRDTDQSQGSGATSGSAGTTGGTNQGGASGTRRSSSTSST